MVEIKLFIRDVMLNFFLILTPIYFYHYIINNYSAVKSKLYLGLTSGFAAILCMTFPIVSGSGFLWDLRWVSLMISILYGGILSGGITGLLLVSYRFSLGGGLAAVNTMVVALVLLAFFTWARKIYSHETMTRKFYLGILFSSVSFSIVVFAIWIHFLIIGKLSFFYGAGPFVFISMGISYVSASLIYIFFSENIRAFSRMRETVHQAEKVNLISELSILFSFEIKKSLLSIKKLIEDSKHASERTRGINMKWALEEVEKTQHIVSEYVNYTKKQPETKQEFSLNKIIFEIIELVEPYAIQKKIKLTAEMKEEITVIAETIKLKQALLNIVKNAADATPKGGAVCITAVTKGKELWITVADTGIGMTKEQLSSIIEFNYSTVDSKIGRGLTVTFHLVESMGGQLHFESKVGEGTVVTMKFRELAES